MSSQPRKLENLPNELLIEIALNMDVIEVLSLCNTSKRINNSLCLNRFFWMEKLKRDYYIPYDPLVNYNKQLYMDVKKYFDKIGKRKSIHSSKYNINDLLFDAVFDGNKDIIIIALNKGADILYKDDSTDPPQALDLAALKGDVDIFEFVMSLMDYELSPEEKPKLLNSAAAYGSLNMVKYLIEELDSKVVDHTINDAKYMLCEYDREPRRSEQMKVIEYLESHKY